MADSVEKVYTALAKAKSRLDKIAAKKVSEIRRGQAEIADLECLLNETRSRVTTENTKHQSVVNNAVSIRDSIQVPVKK